MSGDNHRVVKEMASESGRRASFLSIIDILKTDMHPQPQPSADKANNAITGDQSYGHLIADCSSGQDEAGHDVTTSPRLSLAALVRSKPHHTSQVCQDNGETSMKSYKLCENDGDEKTENMTSLLERSYYSNNNTFNQDQNPKFENVFGSSNVYSDDITDLDSVYSRLISESPLWESYRYLGVRSEWPRISFSQGCNPLSLVDSCIRMPSNDRAGNQHNVLWNPLTISESLEAQSQTESRGRKKQRRPPHSRSTRNASRRRRQRQTYTVDQLGILEEQFSTNHYLRSERRQTLSQSLGLTENQIKAWFQNRRTKHKKQRSVHGPTDSIGLLLQEINEQQEGGSSICLTDTAINMNVRDRPIIDIPLTEDRAGIPLTRTEGDAHRHLLSLLYQSAVERSRQLELAILHKVSKELDLAAVRRSAF